MIITDERRGMEFHFDMTEDNKIRKVEIIFAEPKDFSCVFRPEGLFAMCGGARPPHPVQHTTTVGASNPTKTRK